MDSVLTTLRAAMERGDVRVEDVEALLRDKGVDAKGEEDSGAWQYWVIGAPLECGFSKMADAVLRHFNVPATYYTLPYDVWASHKDECLRKCVPSHIRHRTIPIVWKVDTRVHTPPSSGCASCMMKTVHYSTTSSLPDFAHMYHTSAGRGMRWVGGATELKKMLNE
jgi:hypothetical protein